MKTPDTMVCARSDAPFKASGSTFDKKCARCDHGVMMAPSGQAKLKQHPDMEIICAQCFFATSKPTEQIALAAEPEVILQEIAGAEPNLRSRNN